MLIYLHCEKLIGILCFLKNLWRQRSTWINNNINSKSKWKNNFHKKRKNEYYFCLGKRLNELSAIKRNPFFFETGADKIGKVIGVISLEKSHDHQEISNRVFNLSQSIISEPLFLTFKICPYSNTFPHIGKKGNEIPHHKKATNKFYKNIFLPCYN